MAWQVTAYVLRNFSLLKACILCMCILICARDSCTCSQLITLHVHPHLCSGLMQLFSAQDCMCILALRECNTSPQAHTHTRTCTHTCAHTQSHTHAGPACAPWPITLHMLHSKALRCAPCSTQAHSIPRDRADLGGRHQHLRCSCSSRPGQQYHRVGWRG